VNAPALDTQLEPLLATYQGRGPGAALLIVRAGEAPLCRTGGMADLEMAAPVTSTTNFRLASLTKQFTATAILLLAERGLLALEDSIRRWLPGLPDAVAAVRVRHLLTHTSGLIDFEEGLPAQSSPLRDADVLRLLEAHARTYFLPGSAYRYSNSGYVLLGLIVARASGLGLAEFMREQLFAPLGMASSMMYEAGGARIEHRAFGYSRAGEVWVRTDQSPTSGTCGDGGMYSCLEDLARWDAALREGRLLKASTWQAMFAVATPTDDPAVGYGLGWRVTGNSVWHSGESIGFRHVIVRYPREGVSIVLLTNRNEGQPYLIALAAAELCAPHINPVRAYRSIVGPDAG
jgi:CubicO group peptidase (beta-lactamase class C family)